MKGDIFAGGLYATLTARILPLAKALEDYGVECKVILPIAWHSIAKGKLGNVLSIALTHPPSEYAETLGTPPDIGIIGRVSTPQIYLLQKLLKCKGVKTIFDLDDATFLPTGKLVGINVRPGSFCLERIIKNVDSVIVNGHYLLRYVKKFNDKANIIHDPVDTKIFSPKHRSKSRDKITIGWEGNAKVNYENLVMLIDPLKKLARKYDIRFKIASYLGDLRIKRTFETLESLMEIDYGSDRWLPQNFFAKLLYDFDIMVAPLRRNAWYEGKSALRVGIGMAMGIPVVASPVGEQKYIIKNGINGFLAKDTEEWYQYLNILIENNDLRRTMGKHGLETVEKELSLDVNGKKLYQTLARLI